MKKHQIFILLALLLITVFTFYPALNADFVNLDDPAMVTHNWKIKSFSAENIKAMLFEPYLKLYHPLVNLSYAAEYFFFGADAYFYHADNLILHLLNVLLVFFIFFFLSGKNFTVSFLTALIFACHPLHVESVAWVSARKDTLYAFFFLASWLMYLKSYSLEGKKKFFAFSFSLFLFVCALLSKSMAVTLPAVLVLSDWLTGRGFAGKKLLKYIPFMILAGAFSLVTFLFYYTPGQQSEMAPYILYVNFVSAHFNILFYIAKFAVPVKLSVIYPYFFDPHSAAPDFILKAPALVYGLAVLALYSLKKTKKIVFGVLFFLITVLPVINILPTGISPVADRYTYIPYIGFGYIAASALFFLYGRLKGRYMKAALQTVTAVCMAVMCVAAHARAEKWLNDGTLFGDVIKNYPGQIAKAYANRGGYRKSEGNIKEAEKDFQAALFFESDNSEGLYNLAVLRINKKKYDEALLLFKRIDYYDYNIEGVYMYQAKLYYEKGQKEKAYRIIENGIKRFPKISYLYETLAIFQAYDGSYEKATENLTKAKKLRPSNPELYLYQTQIYDILGQYSEAEAELKTGIANCAGNADLMRKLGELYLDYNDYGKASVQFARTTKKHPGDYLSYNYLGDLEKRGGNHKKALYYYTLAALIKNDYSAPYFNRAEIFFEMNLFDKAVSEAERAKQLGFGLKPEFQRALKEKSGMSV